jgi:hypothetical protein
MKFRISLKNSATGSTKKNARISDTYNSGMEIDMRVLELAV